MGFLRIHCGGCGQVWEVYRKAREYDASRECPHCGKRIDPTTWHKHVLRAFDYMADANLEVMRDHADYHQGAFKLDYVETGSVDREGGIERMNNLSERRYNIEERLANL